MYLNPFNLYSVGGVPLWNVLCRVRPDFWVHVHHVDGWNNNHALRNEESIDCTVIRSNTICSVRDIQTLCEIYHNHSLIEVIDICKYYIMEESLVLLLYIRTIKTYDVRSPVLIEYGQCWNSMRVWRTPPPLPFGSIPLWEHPAG